MDFLSLAPEPKSLLARHRILSPHAGVRVSPICLGAMNFGDSWKDAMGECTRDSVFEILDYFRANGGNFIDTAINYQNQESERWIGEWMASRQCRDEMVIATKFSSYYRNGQEVDGELPGNYLGNSTKNLRSSLKTSLENLKTDYIDVLYVHIWEFSVSIEELMQSLNREVQAGRVLYLGMSDCPAWVMGKANQYARDYGLRQFCIYQGPWNCALRDMEREQAPVCINDGMAIAPWRALGGGSFKTKAERERAAGEGRNMGFPPFPQEEKMVAVLEKLAKARKTKITSIAFAYVTSSAPDVFPLVGTRKLEHLVDAIAALDIKLTAAELAEIREASDFDTGFPHNILLPGKSPMDVTTADHIMTRRWVHVDVTERRQPAFAPSAK